jgi:uncharacterized protein YeaO (DUF488 family)
MTDSVTITSGEGQLHEAGNHPFARHDGIEFHAKICRWHTERGSEESRMSVRVVRLGTARTRDEGVRIGTVRRPPRGVPKNNMKLAQAARTAKQWQTFFKKYRAEMATPENSHALDLLARLSHETNFSVGCYCEDESRCHRSALKALLAERGAKFE